MAWTMNQFVKYYNDLLPEKNHFVLMTLNLGAFSILRGLRQLTKIICPVLWLTYDNAYDKFLILGGKLCG